MMGGRATLIVLLVVGALIIGALSPWLVMLSVVVGLLHVLLLLVGPGMLVFNLIAQIIVLTVLGPVAALLVSIIVLLFAFLLTFFFVHFRAHVLLIGALRLLHGLLMLMLLLGGRFGVLALFQIDQIVHRHYRLLAEAMLRILLLILAFVLLGAHCLVSIARLTIIVVVVPAWRILLGVHRLFGCLHLVLVESLVVRRIRLLRIFVVILLARELHVFLDVELWTAFFRLLLLHGIFLGLGVVAVGTLVHLTGLFCLFVLVYA